MKKRILTCLVLLSLVLGALFLTSCTEDDLNAFFGWGPVPSEPPKNGCAHAGATVVEATIAECKTGGKTVYHCPDCDSSWTVTTPALGHDYKHVDAKSATCTEGGWRAYDYCTRCTYTTKVEINPLGHNIEHHDAKAPGCETPGYEAYEKCKRCSYSTYEEIGALGHALVPHEGKAATESEAGWLPYDTCSRCDYSTYEKVFATASLNTYHGSYWYDLLAAETNGEKKQLFYDKLEEVCAAFHKDTTTDAEVYVHDDITGEHLVGKVDFSEFSLNSEEANAILGYFRADHPLYYWMSTLSVYSTKELYLLVPEEYAEGATRAEYNAEIYAAVKGYAAEFGAETSAYEIAKFFHDELNDMLTYAFKDDGVTPETASWAHNVLGAFDVGMGVCESYARAFQILLNAYEVENIFVSGLGDGVNHAWNLVKLDDGQWYWCDVTWDDSLTDFLDTEGVYGYTYFCVDDDDDLVFPSGVLKNDTNFLAKHSTEEELPDRADTTYVPAA